MSFLLIGDAERREIADLIAYAKAHPVLFEQVREGALDPGKFGYSLADRKPGFKRPQSRWVLLPGNFRASYSVEDQPAGLCAHLSISVEGRRRKGMMPHPEAVKMIAEEFGMPFPGDKLWLEEYEPGEHAVNLLHLYAPRAEGHA